MALPGWYPDPSGAPRSFRYWDGARWSATVAGSPYGPVPPGMAAASAPSAPRRSAPAPQPPVGRAVVDGFGPPPDGRSSSGGFESYAAIGPLPAPASSAPASSSYDVPSPRSGGGRALGLLLLAIGATLVLGVISFLVVRELIDDDATATASSSSPAPQAPAPTPAPTPVPEPTPAPVDARCTAGQPAQDATGPRGRFMTGGGLRLVQPDGFDRGDQGPLFGFADGVYAPARLVEQGATSSWVAVYALGALARADGAVGAGSLRRAAAAATDCLVASPDFYPDLAAATELDSRRVRIDGARAWQVTTEIRIDNPDLDVEGDVARVVVVDTGIAGSYGLFVSVVPIGDDELIAAAEGALGELRVR